MESKKYGRALTHYVVVLLYLIPVLLIFSFFSEFIIKEFLGREWYFIHRPLDVFMEFFLAILAIWYTYQESIHLDEEGIWFEGGLTPWDRGFIFIKWQDIERVGYSQNPIGYLFGSANVHITRRYNNQEIVIKGIFKGRQLTAEAFSYQNPL